MGFEVLTAVSRTTQVTVFWYVTPSSFVPHFEGPCRLRLQQVWRLAVSEMLVPMYQATQCHKPGGFNDLGYWTPTILRFS